MTGDVAERDTQLMQGDLYALKAVLEALSDRPCGPRAPEGFGNALPTHGRDPVA